MWEIKKTLVTNSHRREKHQEITIDIAIQLKEKRNKLKTKKIFETINRWKIAAALDSGKNDRDQECGSGGW